MPWYRRPEEDVEPPDAARGRGRGRPRGRARGRGRGRAAPEPSGASPDTTLPPHMYVMGPHGPYVPYPYYHNPSRMEEMLPHWQFVLRAQQESQRTQNPATLGHARRRDAQAGPNAYGNYEAAANREHFNSGVNMDSPFATQQRGLDQSSGFHYPVFSHPTYARYTNQTNTPQKGPQQRVDNRTNRRGESSNDRRASTVRTEASQRRSNSRISNSVSSQAPNVQDNGDPTHHMTDLVATFGARPPAPKTLDETAAFLNQPQLVFQKNKISNSSIVTHPLHATREDLSQTAIVTRDQARAAALHHVQLRVAQEQVQALSARDTINAIHDDRSTSSQIPDFRKYSELSVTIAKVKPPQAYQASVAKNLDLLTPPLAHQAPVTHTPAQLQSARLHALSSPPPAHQNSTTHSIDLMHPSHLEEQTYANPHCHQARHLSFVKTTADNILTASHATYDRTLRKAEFIYEPSTETLTAENVMYRPEKDLLTKERVVYQRNNLKFTKTEILHKDIVASQETVYEPDKVTARKTVIQRPTAMETAKQQNVTSAFNSMQYSPPDIFTAAELRRQQTEIIAAAQTRAQALVEAEQRSRCNVLEQMIATEQTRNKALVEVGRRSRSDTYAQIIAAEHIRANALVEAAQRSHSDAIAKINAAQQIRAKTLVEAEQLSQSGILAQMFAAAQTKANALVEAAQRSQNDAIAHIIAAQQTHAKAFVEAEQLSQSGVIAQMFSAEQTAANALVETRQRSQNDAIAHIIAAQQTRAKAFVEAEQLSQSGVIAQMFAAEQTEANALLEARQRSQSDAIAHIIAAQQTRAKAFVEAEQLSQSSVIAQMFAAEQTEANALLEARQRSQSDAIAHIIAAQQTRAKAFVEEEQQSQSSVIAQMFAAEQTEANALVEAAQNSQSDAIAHIISAQQTRAKAVFEAEHRSRSDSRAERQSIFQSAVDAQARSRRPSLRETEVHAESLRTTPNRRHIPSNQHEQDQSSNGSSNIQLLQWLMHCNALNNSSDSVTPSQTLRQTRKRKKSPTQPSRQVIPRYAELLTNNVTTDASDDDDY